MQTNEENENGVQSSWEKLVALENSEIWLIREVMKPVSRS